MYAALLGFVFGLLFRVKNQLHSDPQTATSKKENPPSQSSPIVITYTPPPLTDEEITQKKEKERREKTKFRVEKWGLVVLALYTVFTGFIAWETKEATEATKLAADSAAQNAKIAVDSLNITTEQFRLDQRPWIGVVETRIPESPQADKDGHILIEFKNLGKTPALNVHVSGISRIEPGNSLTDIKDAAKYPIKSSSVLMPNSSITVPSRFRFTALGITMIRQGKFRSVSYGIVTYDDTFGGHHTTWSCLFLNDDLGSTQPCEKYNNAN